jgi:chromosome partition protein MukE
VQSGGRVTHEHVLNRLTGLVGERELAGALEPRRRRFDDQRIVHDLIRKGVASALQRLERMGFIDAPDEEHLRLRAPLLRFAEPVRGLEDADRALERLITSGEVVEPDAFDEKIALPSTDEDDEEGSPEAADEEDDEQQRDERGIGGIGRVEDGASAEGDARA